jgi:hypothetical protein
VCDSLIGLVQLRRLHSLGRRVRLVAMVRDLDDIADLRALAAGSETGHLPAMARTVLATVRAD